MTEHLTHHAYICEGPASALPELSRDAGERTGAGEIIEREYEKFGIDEARELRELASLRSGHARTLFVVGAASMTTEAQQALLKLLEEPRLGAVFVLLVPHGVLLPTVRSRCLPYPGFANGAQEETSAAPFLKMSYKERTDFLAKMLKDDEGVRERVRDFLNALERLLYAHGLNAAETRAALQDIVRFRSYLADRSPSLKMLLEHLAALLPRT